MHHATNKADETAREEEFWRLLNTRADIYDITMWQAMCGELGWAWAEGMVLSEAEFRGVPAKHILPIIATASRRFIGFYIRGQGMVEYSPRRKK